MSDPIPALSAKGLSIGHEKRPVVSGIDFELDAGSSLALVGGNGSGKTTMLRTLAGLIPPLSGTVRVLGTEPSAAVRRVAWLGQFQNTNPLLPLRARDVVRMAFYPGRGLWGTIGRDDENAVDEALAFFGASAFAKKPISELSGGQRQRVYLAYVLARRAELVLMDEPLSNLDVIGMDLYAHTLENWKAKGTTVVVATHSAEDAAACDRTLLLEQGRWRFGTGLTLEHDHHH